MSDSQMHAAAFYDCRCEIGEALTACSEIMTSMNATLPWDEIVYSDAGGRPRSIKRMGTIIKKMNTVMSVQCLNYHPGTVPLSGYYRFLAWSQRESRVHINLGGVTGTRAIEEDFVGLLRPRYGFSGTFHMAVNPLAFVVGFPPAGTNHDIQMADMRWSEQFLVRKEEKIRTLFPRNYLSGTSAQAVTSRLCNVDFCRIKTLGEDLVLVEIDPLKDGFDKASRVLDGLYAYAPPTDMSMS